jgi:NAD(P)-dependent dehydrogenase (short-subunit alcohol dehydrogenase family)
MSLATDLTGRVALVTGSSRGLGAATAQQLAQLGAELIITYRTGADDAADVARVVSDSGVRGHVHRLDMGDADSIAELFEWIATDGPGRLDILVANAATTSFKPLVDQKRHNVERTFAISVTGFLDAVQRSIPLMRTTGQGRIVAVSGADTRGYGPVHGLMAAAKAAMEMLVRYLQIELVGTGVTAIGVNPDAFRSAGPELMFGDFYERLMQFLGAIHPLGRVAEAEDMGALVAFACTDAALWLTGTTIDADAGAMFAKAGRAVETAAMMPPETLSSVTAALAALHSHDEQPGRG